MNEQGTSIRTPIESAAPAESAARTDGISLACHEGAVPAAIEAALPALYGNIHSTLAHLRIYGGLDQVTHTYVARRHGNIIAVFLFRLDGDVIRVINEGMQVGDHEIDRFAGYVFAKWRWVKVIIFHAIESTIRMPAYLCQRYVCTANIVLPLPSTADAYVASLGKNMRRNLRRYMDKLKRAHPSFRFDVFEREGADERHVRELLNLNRARITGKNKAFAIDDEEEKIIALVKETGLVGVATIDGQVMGGAVGYLVGDCYHFKIIAHDPKYNDYSAGILSCYLMICECIRRGCREYNFMWNEYEYKFALGAFSRGLEHVVIYRSRLQFLLHPWLAGGVAISRYRRQVYALLDKAGPHEDLGRGTRLAIDALNALRNAKKSAKKLFGHSQTN
ncbi:MAG TPA: GNAT family N-acetyltransferase [Noviherbaspirillum sp.]